MSLRTMAGDGRVRPGRRAAQEMTPGAGARLIDEGLDAVQARTVMATPRTAGAGTHGHASCCCEVERHNVQSLGLLVCVHVTASYCVD